MRSLQRLVAEQELRVLARVDVVGDDADAVAVAQGKAQLAHQRGLSRADGPPIPTRSAGLLIINVLRYRAV
jgi:hypothetical protein